MKILHVFCGPFPTSQGTQTLVEQTCRLGANDGHEIHLLCYAHGRAPRDLPFEVHRLPDRPAFSSERSGISWQKPFLDLSCAVECRRLIRDLSPGIVHAHHYEALLAARIADPLRRRPLLFHAHALMAPELHTYLPRSMASAGRIVGAALDMAGPRLADTTVAVSDDVARSIERLVDPGARIEVLYPPAMTPSRIDRPGKRAGEEVVAVYTGNLDSYQGVDRLLEAMALLPRDVESSLRLQLVTASEHAPVSSKILALGLQGTVELVPHGSFDEVWQTLCGADIAVVPRCVPGGVPIKLINALSAGIPVLADRDLNPSLSHMEQAVLVDARRPEEIARGLSVLVRDPGIRASLGMAGRAWVMRECSPETHAAKLTQIYLEMVR